jgi:hypothetical protein
MVLVVGRNGSSLANFVSLDPWIYAHDARTDVCDHVLNYLVPTKCEVRVFVAKIPFAVLDGVKKHGTSENANHKK